MKSSTGSDPLPPESAKEDGGGGGDPDASVAIPAPSSRETVSSSASTDDVDCRVVSSSVDDDDVDKAGGEGEGESLVEQLKVVKRLLELEAFVPELVTTELDNCSFQWRNHDPDGGGSGGGVVGGGVGRGGGGGLVLTRDQKPFCEKLKCAAVLIDISGFTPLSERLQREEGAKGTEQLSSILNEFFGGF
jgi:hypothetical protein